MKVCPTCGRKHYTPSPPKTRTCWSCGAKFQQQAGRPRLVCSDPKCEAKRRLYRKRGLAALDSMEG